MSGYNFSERSKMASFDELLHTTIDITSLEDYKEWIDIVFKEAESIQKNLHDRRERGEPDKELEDFILGKIAVAKAMKYNFDRAIKCEEHKKLQEWACSKCKHDSFEECERGKKMNFKDCGEV